MIVMTMMAVIVILIRMLKIMVILMVIATVIYDDDKSDSNYQIMNARITLHIGRENF